MDVARQHGWGPLLLAVACVGKPTRGKGHTNTRIHKSTRARELLRMSGRLHHDCIWALALRVMYVRNRERREFLAGVTIVIRITLAFPKSQCDGVV